MKTIEWNEEQRKAFLGLVKRICSANRRKSARGKTNRQNSKNTKVWFMPKRAEQVFNAMGLCV